MAIAILPEVVIQKVNHVSEGMHTVSNNPIFRATLLAAVQRGLAAVPASAKGRGSGDGWRSVRLCQSDCWAKHPDGWGAAWALTLTGVRRLNIADANDLPSSRMGADLMGLR